jgi:DNA-binding MurR/RpiR family transcriptional regulator
MHLYSKFTALQCKCIICTNILFTVQKKTRLNCSWSAAGMYKNRDQSELKGDLGRLAKHGAPAVAVFAVWVLENYTEVAFNSIRRVAALAEVNSNTVYNGYDAFRRDVQFSLRRERLDYAQRAQALHKRPGPDLFAEVLATSRENTDVVFSPETLDLIQSCVSPMLAANKIYSVGVRSCYSIAHYLSYVGGIAFDNFVRAPNEPGGIMDQMANCREDDIVVAISYHHYSAEVVRACNIAKDRGARILAMTDSHTAPISLQSWKTLILPMAGPQVLPSLTSAFLVAETLLAAMACQFEGSFENVEKFETVIKSYGGYV